MFSNKTCAVTSESTAPKACPPATIPLSRVSTPIDQASPMSFHHESSSSTATGSGSGSLGASHDAYISSSGSVVGDSYCAYGSFVGI